MKRNEVEKLRKAFNRLLKKLFECDFVSVPEGELLKAGRAVQITKEDYEVLKPFIWARVEKKYCVGGVEVKISGLMPVCVTQTDDYAYIHIAEDAKNASELICDIYNMAEYTLSSYKRIRFEELYKEY